MVALTRGCIAAIHAGEAPENPVMQVLSMKRMPGQSGTVDRYRVICSDGEYYTQAMLSTSLNHLAEDGQLDKNSVFICSSHACNQVQNKKIMVVLDMSVLPDRPATKIGEPVSIETRPANAAQPANGHSNGDVEMSNARPQAAATTSRPAATANARSNARPNATSSTASALYPIDALSPYQNKWTIKARVTNKSDIRTWSNAKGDGKLFSCTFMDESGEIRATGFNEAVDNFYNLIEEGKVYTLTKARIGIAKKQFNNVKHEYEITLNNDSIIELCTDTDNIPAPSFSFTTLADIQNVDKDATCDVLAVVKDVGEMGTIMSKATQREIKKRELTLVDASQQSIRLTLWGKQAESFEQPENPVIAFKGVKVGDFGGKSLSMVSSSSMMVEPDIPDAHALRGWFDSNGGSTNFTAFSSTGGGAGGSSGSFKLSEFRTIDQIKQEGLGQSDTPQYFNMRATVVFIKDSNMSYPACPTDRCNKKLIMEGNDVWRCEKCDTTYEAPEYRYVLSLSVGDHTGQCWLSAFNDVGCLVLGHTAGEMEHMKENNEMEFRKTLAKSIACTWNFSCRARSDTFNDQVKVRYQVLSAKPVDYVEAGKQLVEMIQAYDLST